MDAKSETKGIKDLIASFGRALTADEIADLFGISAAMIYKNARSGNLPSFRIGTSVRFDPQKVCEWIDRQTIDQHGDIEKTRRARVGTRGVK